MLVYSLSETNKEPFLKTTFLTLIKEREKRNGWKKFTILCGRENKLNRYLKIIVSKIIINKNLKNKLNHSLVVGYNNK